MTIEYKFIAKNNKEDEVRALEFLEESIEHKRRNSLGRVKFTILPIQNAGGMISFSIVLKCKGDFDHCGYKARMNNPERITNLLLRLSEKTGVNYDTLTPETMYSEMSRTERFTRNGVSYRIHIMLEQFDSSSSDRKSRIMIRVDACDEFTGISINDFPHVVFYRWKNVPESRILKSVNDAIRRANSCMFKK